MKLSENWLREWVNPDIDTKTLAHQLTMAGLEVAAVEPVAGSFHHVVVGEVKQCEKHPDAKKLSLCQVDIGEPELLSIVCGAENVRQHLKVAVACIGAELPNGLLIKETQLRGALSQGMLCSASELGLSDASNGIMELAIDAPIGTDLRDYLQLDDHSIDIELTANRGDCLNVNGIAREVAVINRQTLNHINCDSVTASINDSFPITIDAAQACPRYIGRIIRNINPQAESPLWLQERLRRSGLRSIDPVVDVTNYVMLELGQPMHSFDLEKLQHGITVRMAQAKEKLTLLDDQKVELYEDTLVIADASGAIAMAGIMGGKNTGVSPNTQHIFLESAFFAPIAIAGQARRYGLHTDSSHRYERGVDANLQQKAIERATALLLSIVGGQAGPISNITNDDYIPQNPLIQLRAARIELLLGLNISTTEIEGILKRLGMQVDSTDSGVWQVQAPSYRFDIAIEEDLIEEIGRIHGYHHLPDTQPKTGFTAHVVSETQTPLKRFRDILIDRDYQEAITYSFVDPQLQQKLTPDVDALPLINPISPELSVMRNSLWPGLLQSLLYNQNRQQNRIRLFESGMRFTQQADKLNQEPMLAGLACGDRYPKQWAEKSNTIDFYDIKADIEALLATTGDIAQYEFKSNNHPALHPGQAASIHKNGELIGLMGILHPKLQLELNINQIVCLFELSLEKLAISSIPRYTNISKYPAIRRDIAMVIDESVTSQAICSKIAESAGQLLTNIDVFDVYAGKSIEKGKKSIALGLTLQDPSRTLIDSEINDLMQTIVGSLTETFNATLRA